MIKFDEKGQAFWDFILETASIEFIEAIQRDLEDKNYVSDDVHISSVTDGDYHMFVYLKVNSNFIIHRFSKIGKRCTSYALSGMEIEMMSRVINDDKN